MFNSLRPFGSLAPFNSLPDEAPQGLVRRVATFAAVAAGGGLSPYAAVALPSQVVNPLAAVAAPTRGAVDPFAATSRP